MSEHAPQGDAADAFASRARDEYGESIRRLVVFGNAARGDDRGVHTSVEVLLVLEDSAERSRGKSEISRPSGDDVSRDSANSRVARDSESPSDRATGPKAREQTAESSETAKPPRDDGRRKAPSEPPRDDADDELEGRLEALAETVGLEHGVVFEVHILPAERFEAQRDHPFVRTALEEGHSYV